MNKQTIEQYKQAVQKHQLTTKDKKKIQKKIKSLKKSRVPGTNAIAEAIEQILQQKETTPTENEATNQKDQAHEKQEQQEKQPNDQNEQKN